ncbi:uncharacterized protein FIBRA_08849 [Fibroporia radiculosa]|uniref:Uncharacterized protein n=1 Tax=Fibroporia radiculosa TaxID=599839 RepID=J4I3E9_9APHY|nr:uncharacterized protein FIBRA_08849 [Fibroporia radiculosa]CCM06572.1 predicted protein [Fibroporia radiculosa]
MDSELLIHAADVEGLCQGIDEDLVTKLGQWVTIPTTYAGGANSEHTLGAGARVDDELIFSLGIDDLRLVDSLSEGKVDLTYGSSLDIFGGALVKFDDLVMYNSTTVIKIICSYQVSGLETVRSPPQLS